MLPFLIVVIHADTCPNVTVVEISNENGDVGKYFMFSAEEFTKMVGYDKWYGQKFIIVQSGSQSWDGKVEVWKDGNTSVGKKYDAAADGDWKVNDTIKLKGCNNPDNPCKDVTFGECDPNNSKSNVISINTQQSVQLCNEDCYNTSNCTIYRYNNQTKECTLITDEYRIRDCNIIAGPMDKKATYCLEQIRNPICDSHVEEDCEYNGEFLTDIPEGGSGEPSDCRKTCEDFAPDCKYWIHDSSKRSCILKRDERKTCNIWVGPKTPSYQHCRDISFNDTSNIVH